jgi:hypothetical protein
VDAEYSAAMNFGEHQLVQRIKERYAMPEYATLANVGTPSGTYADAVAINLWRSRGYEVIGFEVKSARSDWLREKKDPQKAEACAAYCNTFWIVANEGVVKLDELPLGWGLMEPQGKGLVTRQKAKPLDHKRDLTVPFMVNLIRRALEKGEMTEELNAAREAGRQVGIELGRKANEPSQMISLREENERWKKLAADFKERTGIELSAWSSAEKLARLWRLVDRTEWVQRGIEHAILNFESAAKQGKQILAEFRAGVGDSDAT